MPDVRYLRTMISGVPVVAAHAGIDIITAALSEGGELRLVVPADGAVARVYFSYLDHQGPRFSGLAGALTRQAAAARHGWQRSRAGYAGAQASVWRKGDQGVSVR